MPLQDSTTSNGKSALDTASITDFSPSLGKVANDSLTLEDRTRPDSIAKDAVALSDSPSIQANVFHPLAATDTVGISDGTKLDSSPRDIVALSESASVQTTVFYQPAATDTVALRDATRPDSAPRDTVSLSESATVQTNVHWDVTASDVVALSDARSLSKSATETMLLADSASLPSLTTSTVVSIADAASRASVVKKQALDSIAATDAISIGPGIKIGETITVTEAIEATPSAIYIFDSLAASDAVGAPRERAASDSLDLDDAIVASRGAVINESIGVSDQFGGVSAHWSRNFAESFTLQDCTPFACNQVLHFGESLALGGEFAPPPVVADAIAVGDSIARTVVLGRGLSDTATIAARGEWTWNAALTPPPPGSPAPSLGMSMASNATVVKPMAGTPVGGTFILLTASQLVSQINPPTLSIGDWASYPDLSKVAMVLPTYQVNLAPTQQLPGDDAMLTVRMARVPADMPVLMPVDLSGTPQTSEHGNVPWMKVEYTPKVDSTDFAMLMTIIDSQPAGAPELLGGVNALYVDFDWVGSFSGADPGASGHYNSPPTLTFAISDAWASQQGVLKDSNGVPVMSLSVLDEDAGAWRQVSAIDSPAAAVDGQYVYVAHLEHFSTYAVTAGKAVRGGGGGGQAIAQQPAAAAAGIVAQLADSVAVGDDSQARAIESIEEFSKNKSVTVMLLDQLRIATKPVGYGETVLAGKDATARMTLESVETEEGAFGSAVAKVLIHMGNKGDRPELFVLDYFYIDEAGKKAYESSRTVEIAPGELKVEEAKIPFTRPGTYQLLMEVRSDDGALLGVMQVQVEVPWLAANLYPLAAAVGAILASTVTAMAVYASRRAKVLGGG